MAAISPSRLRTKTSEFTDLFRSTAPSSYHAPQPQKDGSSSTYLDIPSGDESSSSKKKITRIPLFGRSRKKSNQSAASSPYATGNTIRDSSDVGESSMRFPSSSTERLPAESPSARAQIPPVPSLPTKVPFFSSKLTAHFTHSKSSKATTVPQANTTSAQPSIRSSELLPAPRSGSLESGSSARTHARSITPQQAQPAITVSLPADNDEEYQNLFTRPGPSKTPVKSRSASRTSENASVKSNPADSPKTKSSDGSIYRRGHTPASAIAAAVRHQQNSSIGSNRPPSTSSKNSKRTSDSDKGLEGQDGMLAPRHPESPRFGGSDKEKGLPPSLQRRSTVAVGNGSQSETTPKPRVRHLSSHPRSRPPSAILSIPPLPSSPPPSAPLPAPPVPFSPNAGDYCDTSEPKHLQKVHIRPRAHTMGSNMNDSISSSPYTLSAQYISTAKNLVSASPTRPNGEPMDIESASADELRQALKARNKDCEELADMLVKVNEAHLAEINSLEKKIGELEKATRVQQTYIKSLNFYVNKGEIPGVLSPSRVVPNTNLTSSDVEDHIKLSIAGIARTRLMYQSDSGAESQATSGSESIRASNFSGTESVSSILRNKKVRRQYPENVPAISRSATMVRVSKGLPSFNGDSTLPEMPSSFVVKRGSVSSISSTSTSSFLPPSPSITISSLSAIPEGSGSTLLLPRYEPTEQQDEKRLTRTSHRASASSLASSTTAASSSYSSNMKRSRPPSIAQVLEKSPNIDNVLDKLRPLS